MPSKLSHLGQNPRLEWLKGQNMRPYVYVRPENRIRQPGKRFDVDWFGANEPLVKNPLRMDEVDFADQILRLESSAFAASNMPMPRWVFYDCAIVPGFVAGFAVHRSAATPEILDILKPKSESEWLPVSLFIIIPTMSSTEWVAHNLCSINSLIPSEQRIYGLGFLSKAFALWYANVEVLCGITQWASPAMRLHTHYGDFEVLTAFTPVHSYPKTLTYRMEIDAYEWQRFFTQEQNPEFQSRYEAAGFTVDPVDEVSLRQFQGRLEAGGEKFYLNATEIRTQSLDAPLRVYKTKKGR